MFCQMGLLPELVCLTTMTPFLMAVANSLSSGKYSPLSCERADSSDRFIWVRNRCQGKGSHIIATREALIVS